MNQKYKNIKNRNKQVFLLICILLTLMCLRNIENAQILKYSGISYQRNQRELTNLLITTCILILLTIASWDLHLSINSLIFDIP